MTIDIDINDTISFATICPASTTALIVDTIISTDITTDVTTSTNTITTTTSTNTSDTITTTMAALVAITITPTIRIPFARTSIITCCIRAFVRISIADTSTLLSLLQFLRLGPIRPPTPSPELIFSSSLSHGISATVIIIYDA